MRSIVPSKSKPWKHALVEVAAQRRVVVAQIFAGRDEKAAGAGRRIADRVPRPRRHHLDHQRDDVARRAELAVLPGAGDLREHVFVKVALGVAVLHRDVGQEVDHLGEQPRRRDGEARPLHVRRMRRLGVRHGADEGEDVVGDDVEHWPVRFKSRIAPAVNPNLPNDRLEAVGAGLRSGFHVAPTCEMTGPEARD